MNTNPKITISVFKTTHKRLSSFCIALADKGEYYPSFDDTINKLLDMVEGKSR